MDRTWDLGDHSLYSRDLLLKKEWLETNGVGGYATSSLLSCHTRKYHSWLNVHLPEHDGRYSLLSKIQGTLILEDGESIELDLTKYPMIFHPQGDEHLKSFAYDYYPSHQYCYKDEFNFSQKLMMPEGENGLIICYSLNSSKKPLTLRLHPLINYRNIHELTKENLYLDRKSYKEESLASHMKIVRITPYASMPSLFFAGERMEYYPAPRWNYNVEYQEEQERGFDYQEDLFSPGFIEKVLKPGESFYLSVSTRKNFSENLAEDWEKEEKKRKEIKEKTPRLENSTFSKEWEELAYSSRHFLIKNKIHGEAIIAGYPWFVEWGRDSMIALPGLTFHVGKIDWGIKILKTFCMKEKNGLLPNYLPSGYGHEPAYNSVDASLWFFWTLQELLEVTQDKEMIKNNFGSIMTKIIEAYTDEKIPDVYLKANGLIWAGNEETQLTWMDARAYGKPVTPRYGYPVEINALWYNALGFYLNMMGHEAIGDESYANLTYIHEMAGRSFLSLFWSDEKKYLADYVNDQGADFSLRPNQIFAASLHFSPLDHNQKREILRLVQDHLLTPYGLRTLSSESKAFRPHYGGGSDERDSAYHQGTVWPWLLGHFIQAYVKVYSDKQNLESLEKILSPLITNHLYDHGLLSVSEIFDGDKPFRPNGCFAQAWSVAEVLRGFKLIHQAKEQAIKK